VSQGAPGGPEIVVVESNSTDERATGARTGSSGLMVVLRGFAPREGTAVRACVRARQRRLIIVQDADLESDSTMYDALIEPLSGPIGLSSWARGRRELEDPQVFTAISRRAASLSIWCRQLYGLQPTAAGSDPECPSRARVASGPLRRSGAAEAALKRAPVRVRASVHRLLVVSCSNCPRCQRSSALN